MYSSFQVKFQAKGPEASRLRQRKYQVARQYQLPEDLLPGCLTQTHRRCGRPNCHCTSEQGPGHPIWFLTFMSGGQRHVERIPKAWVEEVGSQVEAGRALQRFFGIPPFRFYALADGIRRILSQGTFSPPETPPPSLQTELTLGWEG